MNSDTDLDALLDRYQPEDPTERADLARLRSLLADPAADPWDRRSPLHVTGSAFVVHRPTDRVLLRWHERQQAWIQVGGHGDPGESDPAAVALREGTEETGLPDLARWPAGSTEPLHLAIVPVPPRGDEPAHEHADIRFVLTTHHPDDVAPEHDRAPLRWMAIDEALALTTEANVQESLRRLAGLLTAQGGDPADRRSADPGRRPGW